MKVLAVVVTHNRKELLSRCIDYLLAQNDVPDKLLVINNASTDGTVDMLENRGIAFVTQDNLGSAGGWHRGIQYALENDFDAIWLMDDDGYPDKAALKQLKANLSSGIACASSVVLREDNPEQLVFPMPYLNKRGIPAIFRWPRKVKNIRKLDQLTENGVYPFAHFFNGALISTACIRLVGNVDTSYFIFGDEVDYFFRLRKAGTVVTVVDAKHYHPDVSKRPYTPEKIHYYIKNSLILHGRYFDWKALRNFLAVVAVLARTFSRNGVRYFFSMLMGSKSAGFYRAIMLGFQGRLGKDFHD